MTTRRLFAAVPLDEPAFRTVTGIVERIRADRERAAANQRDVRWVRMDGLHLTLRFLGPTPEGDVRAVAEAVRRAADGHDAFQIGIAGGGAFPNPHRPRALWLGVTRGTEELASLAAALDRELVAAGWPANERPFRAHLTVARSDGIPAGADVARRLAEAAADLDQRSAADRVVLFESITGRGPARYEALETVPLRLRPSSPAQ